MAPEQTQIGVVVAANGDVSVKTDSGMRQLEPGSPVYEGEDLVTGPGSNVEIRFADDTLLSQGADSTISLDNYVYDSAGEDGSELLFKMAQGTFRMVTGKIAEQNPERFKIGSPLATIGIRGTTTVHQIGPDGEKHGVEEIHSGKALLVQSISGELRQISSPQALVDVATSGLMSTVRPMSVQELNEFQSIAPAAIQMEQEMREQQEQEEQQDGEDQEDTPEEGEVEGAEGDQAEGEGEPGEGEGEGEGEPGEGEGEEAGGGPGGPEIPGESVLEPTMGLAASGLGDVVGEVQNAVQEVVQQQMLAVAQEVFAALDQGDFEAAQNLLNRLSEIPDDDDIDELVEGIIEGDDIPEEAEGQTITTDSGDNFILGTSEPDDWEGTTSNDAYKGLGGGDTIDGLAGNDTLHGDEGDDTIYGVQGNDIINGGDGNDSILGGPGNDTIAGDDTSTSDPGNDTIHGGTGDDFMDGGEGYDFVSYDDFDVQVYVDLENGYGSSEYGSDTITNFEGIIGGDACDDLTGDSDNNTFIPGSGNDTVNGNGGIDTVDFSGQAAMTVTLSGGSGSATESGSGEVDTLTDIDNIFGTDNNDYIAGDDNSNYLAGRGGTDSLVGGAGDDTFSSGGGSDSIAGGTGTNTIDYEWLNGSDGGITADYASSETDITYSSGTDSISGIYKIIATEYDDEIQWGNGSYSVTLDGESGSDSLVGGGSDDVLYGSGEDDILRGADGDDKLYGGTENDTLFGGMGDDTLSGGEGNDIFKYEGIGQLSSGNYDKITDFSNETGDDDGFKFDSSGGFATDSFASSDGYSGTLSGKSGAYFVWDGSADLLYYDPDVQSSGDEKVVAEVQGDDVTGSDIVLV